MILSDCFSKKHNQGLLNKLIGNQLQLEGFLYSKVCNYTSVTNHEVLQENKTNKTLKNIHS